MSILDQRFWPGQRVTRPKNTHRPSRGLLHGTVMSVSLVDGRIEYAVKWDGRDEWKRGYLTHGLDAEVHESGPDDGGSV